MDKRELAMNYFLEGYNCAQAIVLAFHEEAGLDREQALRLASSFGGMVSPMLGRVADITGVSTVLYIIIGLAVLACVASYFVPDAPEAVKAEA